MSLVLWARMAARGSHLRARSKQRNRETEKQKGRLEVGSWKLTMSKEQRKREEGNEGRERKEGRTNKSRKKCIETIYVL